MKSTIGDEFMTIGRKPCCRICFHEECPRKFCPHDCEVCFKEQQKEAQMQSQCKHEWLQIIWPDSIQCMQNINGNMFYCKWCLQRR